MRSAMYIVNACDEVAYVIEEGLTEGKHCGAFRRGNGAVELIVDYDLDEPCVAIGESDQDGQNRMIAVWTAAVYSRWACGYSAHHHIVDRVPRTRLDQVFELSVHLGCACLGHRNIFPVPPASTADGAASQNDQNGNQRFHRFSFRLSSGVVRFMKKG